MSEPVLWALVFGVGIVAGALNTLAGGGSLLMLPVFMLVVGLPAPIANGTSRVAVLVQCLTAAATFRGGHIGGTRLALRLSPMVCAGALAGAWLATQLPGTAMQRVMGVVLLCCVPLVLFSGRLSDAVKRPPREVHVAWVLGVSLLVGIYSGFLQAAVGIPILLLLVWGLGVDAVQANHVKVMIIAASMVVALIVFVRADQVDFRYGAIAAGGQALGAWMGARLAITRGLPMIRWALGIAVTVSALEMLGLLR